MAYGGYRGDPLLESLQGLGNTLRGASQDILQRRQLDVTEQGMLAQQEQSRDLARLRTLAQQQSGETELLKTTADIGLKQSAESRAVSAEQRAVELQGAQVEETRFKTERGRQILPGELQEQKDTSVYKRALAKESNARAQMANTQAQMTQLQLDEARRPIEVETINGMLEQTNPYGAEVLRSMRKPGEKVNALGLGRDLTIIKEFYPKGFAEMKVVGLERNLQNENLLPATRVALEEQLRNARIGLGQNPRDDEEALEASIGSRARAMVSTKDPIQRQKMNAEIEELTRVLGGMKKKEGRAATNAIDFFNNTKISKDEIEWIRQEDSATRGHMLGSLDDYLMDRGQIVQPDWYMTPNELYAEIAPQVKPATADEWEWFQKGGTNKNGVTIPPHPDMKTQAQADAYKRELHVTDLHQRTSGNRRQLSQAIGGEAAPQQATTPKPAAMTAPKPTGPFDQSTIRVRQEITAQLQNALGREPSPEEVEARFQQLLAPNQGGIAEKLGRVREFMNKNKPLDLLRGVLPGGTSIPGTGATEMQGR